MTTVGDILTLIETLAPPTLKMEWDKIGLHCGSRTAPVRKVLVALDPFEHVCKEAADWGADLLVTHHPLIFHPVPTLTDDACVPRCLMTLVKHDISHVCAHTNLDCASGGVNDVLAGILGLQNVETIEAFGGVLRMGDVSDQTLEDFLSDVQCNLGCEGLRYVDGGKPVKKVAVGGGGCADALYDAVNAGCDTFVTSDVKYNQFWDARDLGLNLIDAGHFHTENPAVVVLAEKIAEAFPDIAVKISETHADCMKYY